jgi:hypothetical protein
VFFAVQVNLGNLQTTNLTKTPSCIPYDLKITFISNKKPKTVNTMGVVITKIAIKVVVS